MSRIIRRGALVAALAAGIVLAAPTASQAHVGVSPDAVEPGGSAVLTFSFTHGCEESPTTALRITMPDGLASVSPTFDSNWNIAVERADNGLVSAITYTAVSPIPSGLQGAVSMAVQVGEDASESLAFPVQQQCESGINDWVELAEAGTDPHDLDSPAPIVSIAAGDASSAASEHAEHTGAQTPPVQASSTGIILGGAGLLTGLTALCVAVLAYRRSA